MSVHLQTERLQLRRITPDDLDALVELDSDPEVMRYLGGRPTSRERMRDEYLPRILAYYERGDDLGYWAAAERASGAFLGWVFFRPYREGDPHLPGIDRSGIELGYRLRRAAWGRGYATEACRALVERGFETVGVERVFAETMAVNTGSRRVMEKSGLRHTATFHLPGEPDEEVQYALSAADYS
ncbi:GNAT family N-acetyltransferase [Dactylosporangium sp. CA-233914]|uniref:GNAT family N-acetyltransferase n=1 Tax=Dactylosporangium sp. CA-233914 TaxID=3239934 RepID=UPI003D8E5038